MKHQGGSEAKDGFYWKRGGWEIVTVEGERGTLPGPSDAQYVRIPGLLLVPIAFIANIAVVVFLPVIAFAMLIHALVVEVAERV